MSRFRVVDPDALPLAIEPVGAFTDHSVVDENGVLLVTVAGGTLGGAAPVAPTIISGKTQANGAFTSAPYAAGFVPPLTTAIGVETSATPTAGTLLVEYRMNGMTKYKTADVINLVAPVDILLTGYAFDFRFTPTGFDADKTYTVVIAGKD